MEIFNQIYILCAGLISGVIIFQSAIVASSIFTVLPEENAGILLRNLFPKFFLFLIFLSSLSLTFSFLANLNFYPFGFIGILGLLSMSVCYFIIPKKKIELLKSIRGFKVNNPDGAFYVFPDISSFFGKKIKNKIIKNSNDFALFLLEEAHVATVTGEAFGNNNCIRISYAASEKNILEAIKRIKKALS